MSQKILFVPKVAGRAGAEGQKSNIDSLFNPPVSKASREVANWMGVLYHTMGFLYKLLKII